MRKNKSTVHLIVGFFVFISLLIFVTGVFVISGERALFERKYTVKSYFDNTAGLLTGAYVRLSGVRIGTVTDIRFPDSPDNPMIEVRMEVREQGIRRITPDSLATIRTEGLLGARYIEIVAGEKPPTGEIKDDLVIQSFTPPELQEIIGQSEEFLTNIISISESLDKIVKVFGDEENLQNINLTMDSVRESSEALKSSLRAIEHKEGTLHTLIYDTAFASDLKSTVSNLNATTESLAAEDGIMTELRESSANLREITDMLKGGEGTLGALLIDPSVYDSLKGVLGEAERSRFVRSAVRYMIEEAKEKD